MIVNELDEKTTSKRIINALGKARKQLPKGSAGIIYIQLPHIQEKQIFRVIDESWARVSLWLKNDTSRINAVILSYLLNQNSQNSPPVSCHAVIPNYDSYIPLPIDRRVLGIQKLPDENINAKEGALCLRLDNNLVFHKGTTELMLSRISSNGHVQLSIWKTWDNKFRLELTTRYSGRTMVESKPWGEINLPSRIMAIWSLKFASLSICVESTWQDKELKGSD